MDVAPRREPMPLEAEKRVCDELSRTMERGLAAAERGLELGGAVGAEVRGLCCGDGAYFAAAARVYGVEFGGDDGWRRGRCGLCGIFMGEEALDELGLEGGCV